MAYLPVGRACRQLIHFHHNLATSPRMTRQKEYELQAADARRRWEEARLMRQRAAGYYNTTNRPNTMGPQEDVVESRRSKRNSVVMAAGRAASTRTLLLENLLLLIVLAASIFGLYMLSIYLLNQTTY